MNNCLMNKGVDVATEGERLAVLEYKDSLREAQLNSIETKLDSLLELRSKGMGAFWLASALLGTGLLGIIYAVANWMKG